MDSNYRNHWQAVTDADKASAREAPAAGHQVSRVDYDAELRMHNEILRRTYGIRPHDHILDIGCGAGQTTRDAARLAVAGSVLGVDVSAPMIERARHLTEAAGLHNVTFEHADAEIHRFPVEYFDVAISRFGTMFFANPVAAFTNIGRAIRPNGRLMMMVWQNHHRNEWSVSIQRALGGSADVPAARPRGPDPFSLADPTTTDRLLETAGFGDAAFTGVHEPVYYGPDVAAALEWVRGFSGVNDVLQRLDPVSTARAGEQLRKTLAAHARRDGVWFDSRAWIVTARRREPPHQPRRSKEVG
jgi:SAM-dependent methyltransferase